MLKIVGVASLAVIAVNLTWSNWQDFESPAYAQMSSGAQRVVIVGYERGRCDGIGQPSCEIPVISRTR